MHPSWRRCHGIPAHNNPQRLEVSKGTAEWTVWLPDAGYGTVAMVIAIALFIIPAPSTGAKSALLDWDALLNFPWAIILLLGGGFSMASGFSSSGLRCAGSNERVMQLTAVSVL